MNGSGTLERHEAEIAACNNDLDLKAKLRGGWRDDAWRGDIVSLSNAGAYAFELKTPAALEAGAKRVALGAFEAELAGARASVDSVRWESGRLTSSGRMRGLAAQWLAALAHVDKVAGDLALDAEWDLAATPSSTEARRCAAQAATSLSAKRRSGSLLPMWKRSSRKTGWRPRAKWQAGSRARRSKAPWRVYARLRAARHGRGRGRGAARATEPLLTYARVSGRVAASLKIAGTVAAPEISGALRGDALGIEAPPWGIAYHDGRVRAQLEANRLLVTEARIASGDGELTASGTLALEARGRSIGRQSSSARSAGPTGAWWSRERASRVSTAGASA